MTSEVTPLDEKLFSGPIHADVAIGPNTDIASPAEALVINQEDEHLREGSHVAWLVVLSCFLLNFNLLGINYAFG